MSSMTAGFYPISADTDAFASPFMTQYSLIPADNQISGPGIYTGNIDRKWYNKLQIPE
jgi:hypothetical protein